MSIEKEAERMLSGSDREAAEIEAPRFRLVPASELEPRPMDWLVTDLFERDSVVNVYGPPSSAKSFAALDMACSIATGSEYHGRAVQQGPTVYVAGEGFNGIARRLQAWRIVHGIEREDLPLSVSNMPASLTDPENLATVLAALNEIEPALVVVDTVARNFGPADENSTQDMTAFVQACDEIRLAHGCAVMLVHHVGHGDQTRARGSSVLSGAIDTAFRVTKNESGTVLVECTKQKDAVEAEPFAFNFRTVELGFDNDDGTEATSAILHPTDVPKSPPKAQGKNQAPALAALDQLHQRQRENLESSGRNPEQVRVSLGDWRDACVEQGMKKRSFYNVRDALAEKGIIEIEIGGYVRRSNER